MRISVITGVLACTLIIAASGSKADASTNSTLKIKESGVELALLTQNITADDIINVEKISENSEETAEDSAQENADVIKHKVRESESLSSIAKKYETTWKRIFDKNTTIENPDVINPGDELIIPEASEDVEERNVPQPEATATTRSASSGSTRQSSPIANVKSTTTVSRGSSAGNRYVAGYCTWYVKNMRPDLPNNLGNAYSWYSRAAAQGMAVGTKPRAGAVGQRGNHVVYVQSVNSDGTVTISEMNHKGLYVKTVRTLPANYFRYIY